MALPENTRLGPYRIDSLVGAGGMGEVYRARDVRLDRTVAIKILSENLADDLEGRRRFEQEARAVSALNHPHICTLYDIGCAAAATNEPGTAVDYLVMEYVEGETLARRLENGPVPVPRALEYGIQIADALASAHQAGIVHRDLKPGNIMLTKGGIKLLDFGLAKLKTPSTVGVAASEVMTRHPGTTPGTILGTVQYMAPEQLEGREADSRADVWALGCVLYEMITGQHAFAGRSHASLIAAILEHEPPPMKTLEPMSPPLLDHLVRRCLAKDPEERWQSARDVLHELRWIAEARDGAALPARTARRPVRERIVWSGVVLALVAGLVASMLLRTPRAAAPAAPGIVRFSIAGPGTGTMLTDATAAVISPDGRQLAMTVVDPTGTSRLWIRRLDDLSAQPLAGTENATLPFWSPDSRFVGFFASGKLCKTAVGGGSPQVITDAPDGRGATWNKDGVIVFAPVPTGPLFRVSADGGDRTEVERLDASRGERALRFPVFLPDGRHFLFVSEPRRDDRLLNVHLGSIDSNERTQIMVASSVPVPGADGYILFAQGDRLVAQRFDASTLRPVGAVAPLRDTAPASSFDGAPPVSVSTNGVLAQAATTIPDTELVWLDRAGHELTKVPLPRGAYLNPALSPDGRWAAVARPNSPTSADLWLVDLARGVSSRLTFDGHVSGGVGIGSGRVAVWSPDGTHIAYQHNRSGIFDVYSVPASGSGQPEPLVQSTVIFKSPSAWSNAYFVFTQLEEQNGWDLWLLPLHGDRKPVPYLPTPFNEYAAAISPDGRWIAYDSDETGRPEIYVRPFPEAGEKHLVSNGGGTDAQWSKDGRELLIWNIGHFLPISGALSIVAVQTMPTFSAGTPRALFTPRQDIVGLDATSDLQRFLAAVPSPGAAPPSFTIVMNWQAALPR